MYPKKIYKECVRSLKCPPLLPPRNFICVRLVIAYLFPKYYTQRDAHSEHHMHTLRILLFSWFKKLFQPFKSFCRSDKAKHKPVVSKISRMGKSSNAVSFLFRVSGRWVRPWFPTVIGLLHDKLISLLLLPESLKVLLSWTNEGFIFQTSHNLWSGPQNKKGRRTPRLQVKLFAEIG